MSGNWFDWLNSGPGGSAGMQQQMQAAQQQQQAQQQYQTQQTGYLPPEQWAGPQQAQQQMNPAMQQAMPPGMGQQLGQPLPGAAGMSPDQKSAAMNMMQQ